LTIICCPLVGLFLAGMHPQNVKSRDRLETETFNTETTSLSFTDFIISVVSSDSLPIFAFYLSGLRLLALLDRCAWSVCLCNHTHWKFFEIRFQ